MENPLHEAHEKIEELDERPSSRLRTVITVLILVVTMLTTVAGTLAAIWSARQSETQRERQQKATASLQESLTANAQRQISDTAIDDRSEAYWRKTFLHIYAVEVNDKTLAQQLQIQSDSAGKVEQRIGDQIHNEADPTEPSTHSAEDAQFAAALAHESAGWLEKNNEALAVVSMLALALFLLGLALTLGNRATQIGFTALAVVMTVIAGARVVQIQLTPIVAPTDSCVSTTVAATNDINSADYKQADAKLGTVLRECPDYGYAWYEAAQASFYRGVVAGPGPVAKAAWKEAQGFYQKAIDMADVKTGELYNDLGAVQLLNRQYAAAAASLDQARQLNADSPFVLATIAELQIAQGNVTAAFDTLRRAVAPLASAGPYLRDTFFFTNMRYDSSYFHTAGIGGVKVAAFFQRAHDYEAELDRQDMATPFDTHGASIDHIVFRKSKTVFGRLGGAVTFGFSYHGLRAGDVISVRDYAYGDSTFDGVASFSQTVTDANGLVGDGVVQPDTSYRLSLSYQYLNTLEIYLNGVYQGEATYTP